MNKQQSVPKTSTYLLAFVGTKFIQVFQTVEDGQHSNGMGFEIYFFRTQPRINP